jgi:signal transduction histidine kinase/ligand-binding sensor domain-containing protein/CheY-like chemotaxis protein/HPt (histidine-containing phosphotransfer) domain-containing protein
VRSIDRPGAAWRSRLAQGLLALLTVSAASADAPSLVLDHLTTEDGLPQATVMTTLQDSTGFVWLGTEDGLVRYDGHELHRYARSRTEKDSLPGNYVWQVVEDADTNLWIALDGAGVAKWNRRTDRFTSYRHDPSNSNSLATDRIRTVLVDSGGKVWIGTYDAGVDVLDPASGDIEHLRHDPADADSLANDRVSAVLLDRAGDVWVGTEGGLNRWQATTGKMTRVGPPTGEARTVHDKKISRLLEDQSGALWIGTYEDGLFRMSHDGRVLETFRHDARDAASLGSDDVRALLEDKAGRFWVGTADGLALLDRFTGKFTHYRHDVTDNASLRDSFVMSLYEDPAGLMWVGTRTGGVSRWDPRSWELGGRRPAWLENQPITAFADATDNQLWIASLAGLVRFDAATGTATPIDALVGRKDAVGDAPVASLRQDRRGALWIGTMGNGLEVLAPDGTLESIPVQEGDPRSLSTNLIMAIHESRNGAIWLGTFGGGANVLDPATRTVRQLPYGAAIPGALSAPIVTAIAEDARGNLWLGTEGGGLNLARADGTVLAVFRNDPADASTLPSNTVYALAVDQDGRVWVATDGGGLARIVDADAPPDEIEFKVLARGDGLSSDTLWGIVPDARGQLWLSGNAGLMRFDPETGAIKTYHRERGLQGEEFSFGAHYRLRDGRVAFGGPGGFNIFDPATLSENGEPPRVALTNVEVLGVRAAGETPFWLRNGIELDYRGTIVSLDFGVLDFTSPEHNRLAYRIPGLIDDWIDVGAQRRVTLMNLDPGDHVLEVRAANSDSVWSNTPLELTIHRDPAPWASPWAYALYALALLGFAARRYQLHRHKLREMIAARERLEAQVQLRTRELTESNRQLEQAARAKSDFLDRMSHELRTPMNGVVGMTELLARTSLSATQSHLTKTIRSSAQILLQIVNDLLDLSKIRAGKVALEKLPVDLAQVLEECTSMFAGAADSKGIELIVCPPPRQQRILLGDPLRLRQVLMNLVGNAVKFTERGEVVVRADVETVEGDRASVRLAVTDTGIGMDAAAMDKIFEPFAQADETTTRRFGGTGLGLAICRELADLMDGSIAVESQPGVGSTFRLSLPVSLGAAIAPTRAPLPSRSVRIVTRRPSLADSIGRHAAALGLDVLPADTQAVDGDIVVVDASTRPHTLGSLLAAVEAGPPALVVIATSADVESRALRVLLPERQIVLKPVHATALHEAFASALGLPTPAVHEAPAHAAKEPVKAHVLLVEDEAVNAAVAEGYLEALGCTSTWVSSGAAAVACAAAEHFDLILMDLSMPEMDGFATTALIRSQESRTRRAHGNRVPIVALTAHDAVRYRDKCLAADIDDILSKPYTLDDCRRLLQRWLAGADEGRAADPGSAAISRESPLASVDANAVASLRELGAGKQTDLYSKLVALFASSSTQALDELEAAVEDDDLPAAAAVCHKLASAAANVGALAYAQRVKELERHAIAGERTPAREACEELRAAYAPLLEALQSQRLRASA